ncbi:MAG: hypothetical protein LKF00_08545 [Olsenella sp.]|nr:hypothetical protein [Olsenella sp.]
MSSLSAVVMARSRFGDLVRDALLLGHRLVVEALVLLAPLVGLALRDVRGRLGGLQGMALGKQVCLGAVDQALALACGTVQLGAGRVEVRALGHDVALLLLDDRRGGAVVAPQRVELRLGLAQALLRVVDGPVRGGDVLLAALRGVAQLLVGGLHLALCVRERLRGVIGAALGRFHQLAVGAELLLVIVLHLGEALLELGLLGALLAYDGLGARDGLPLHVELPRLLAHDLLVVGLDLVAVVERLLALVELGLEALDLLARAGVALGRGADLADGAKAAREGVAGVGRAAALAGALLDRALALCVEVVLCDDGKVLRAGGHGAGILEARLLRLAGTRGRRCLLLVARVRHSFPLGINAMPAAVVARGWHRPRIPYSIPKFRTRPVGCTPRVTDGRFWHPMTILRVFFVTIITT